MYRDFKNSLHNKKFLQLYVLGTVLMDVYPVNLKDDDEKDEDDSSWGFRVGIDTEFKLDITAKGNLKIIASDGWQVPISMAKRLLIARDELSKLKVDFGFGTSSLIDYIKWGGDVNEMIVSVKKIFMT